MGSLVLIYFANPLMFIFFSKPPGILVWLFPSSLYLLIVSTYGCYTLFILARHYFQHLNSLLASSLNDCYNFLSFLTKKNLLIQKHKKKNQELSRKSLVNTNIPTMLKRFKMVQDLYKNRRKRSGLRVNLIFDYLL